MSLSRENDNNVNNKPSQVESEQDLRAQASLKRSLKEAFIFQNNYLADMTEILNKNRNDSPQEDHNEKKRKIRTEILSKIKEGDGVFLEGLSNSIGSVIKKKAVEWFDTYYDNVRLQPIITLGLNSILDLSYDFPDTQSKLFSAKHWRFLRKKYSTKPSKVKSLIISEKVEIMLTEAESKSKTSLSEASDHIFKYLYKHKTKLSQDEEFMLYTHAFLLDFIQYNHIFNVNIKKDEQEYIVKLWGPIMEKLVQKTDLRLKWDGNSCSLTGNGLHADIRVIYGHIQGRQQQQNDMTQIEAIRQKFDFDHVNVLVEIKGSLDFLQKYINNGLSCIRFCGLELYKYHLTHASDTLYVNNKVGFISIPSTVTDFKFLKDLCSILLNTREEWLDIQRNITLDKKTPATLYPNSSDNKRPSSTKYKKSPTWYPPRPDQRTTNLMPVPLNFE